MEVYTGFNDIHRPLRSPVVTIGNFDGVHCGHKELFRRVKERAVELDGRAVAITFNPHPVEVLIPGRGPVLITSHKRKLQLIESCGMDAAIIVPFTVEFSRISARDFIKNLLVDKIGLKAVIVGHDYRFGHGREGDIEFLRQLGRDYGFQVDVAPCILMDSTIVSSTIIRQYIRKGEVKLAGKFLGRPFQISDTVIHDCNTD